MLKTHLLSYLSHWTQKTTIPPISQYEHSPLILQEVSVHIVIMVELLSFVFNGLSKIRGECSYCDIGGIAVYQFLNILFIISNSMWEIWNI
jgi:hypothetical protein